MNKEKNAAPKVVKAEGKKVYCGPTIRGVANQYTVFEGGIPAKLEELAEKNAAVKALIVPLEKFAVTRERVEREGTAENILFKKALKAL